MAIAGVTSTDPLRVHSPSRVGVAIGPAYRGPLVCKGCPRVTGERREVQPSPRHR
jgi:hypothetical protein